tara:strand:- start:15 stop:938 length:924 start_codon:yes stop_codon:yes gene_type:complete
MNDLFQRDVFIDTIYDAAKKDKNIIFVSADFGAPALDKFRERLPEQFIHSGISEQHMIDMSAGLALSNKKVFVYAMAPFLTLRCFEQIKCSLALMNLPVTIVSIGAGLGYADAGPTHYTTEDVACMRSLVNLEVYSPSDEISTKKIATLSLEKPKLRIIRLERHALPKVHKENDLIVESGYKNLIEGNDVTIISYGHMLHRAIQVCNNLKKDGVSINLIDLFCIKPISKDLIYSLKKFDNIITIEEQCLDGGFGSSILEYLSDHGVKKNVKRLGLPNRYYFENGGREYLLDKYGLSINNIMKIVKEN